MNPQLFKNPLECLLPKNQNNNSYVASGSELEKILTRVQCNIENVNVKNIEESTKLMFSPAFQCFTTMPFYASLLKELKEFASQIDRCASISRVIVWDQLFVLVGAPRSNYSGFFEPVLLDTMKETSVKLMDIEVLFLSFFLAIKQIPDLFHLTTQPESVPLEVEERKKLFCRNAQEFFFVYRNSAFVMRGPLNGLPKEIQNASSLCNIDIQHQFRMLEYWSPFLSSLSREKKLAVCEYSNNTALQKFGDESCTMQQLLNNWSTDILKNKVIINVLFGTVLRLNEMSVLSEEIFSPAYVNHKLRETVYKFDKDNVFDFKKALSAPTLISSYGMEPDTSQTHVKSESSGTAFNSIRNEFDKMQILDRKDSANDPKNKIQISSLLS